MPLLLAGQRLSAADLNDILLTAILPSDITVNTSTTLIDATGLSVPLLANSKYAIDGWWYYTSNPTADAKFGWTFPTGADGIWSIIGPEADQAPVAGEERKNYTDFGAVPLTEALAVAGDDQFTGSVFPSATPRGFIQTAGTAGDLQLQFAQDNSNGSDTILHAGSWLRISRLAG